MQWDDIKAYHLSPPDSCLPRTPAVQAEYETHVAAITATIAIGTYIREKYMADGKLWAFVPNQFPYAFEDETKHWLLWFDDSMENEIDASAILAECGVRQCVFFENHVANRSVKDLRHIHVFTKDAAQPVSTYHAYIH
jgi:hypothetical protein